MSERTKGQVRVAPGSCGYILALDDQMLLAEIRGWGYLTGKGAMGLSDVDAVAIQDANADFLAAAWNACDRLRLTAQQLDDGALERAVEALRDLYAAVRFAFPRLLSNDTASGAALDARVFAALAPFAGGAT